MLIHDTRLYDLNEQYFAEWSLMPLPWVSNTALSGNNNQILTSCFYFYELLLFHILHKAYTSTSLCGNDNIHLVQSVRKVLL